MKESRKKLEKLETPKPKSSHKLVNDSPVKLKDRSILSHDNKKPKAKPPTKSHNKSMPKLKIQPRRNHTNHESSFEESNAFEEYFIFDNRIIPVVNSDEKRAINRYFWTSDFNKENIDIKDLGEVSTADSGFHKAPETTETAMMAMESPRVPGKDQSLQVMILAETKSQDTMTTEVVSQRTPKSFEEVLN